jgi:hypothetical protein
MDAILGIFFKGVGLDMLWHRVVAMAVIGVALLAGGILQLRRRMR